MRRRRFLGTLGTVSLLGLSGCAGLNPLSNPDPPTDSQLEYIEYYPDYAEAETAVAMTIRLQNEDEGILSSESVYIYPNTFGDFQSFELYSVKLDGSGNQIATLNREDYVNPQESRPQHTFDASAVSGGTVLLILGVLSNGTKYTYGAFTKTEDGESLRQVAYVDETSTSQNSTNSTDSS